MHKYAYSQYLQCTKLKAWIYIIYDLMLWACMWKDFTILEMYQPTCAIMYENNHNDDTLFPGLQGPVQLPLIPTATSRKLQDSGHLSGLPP